MCERNMYDIASVHVYICISYVDTPVYICISYVKTNVNRTCMTIYICAHMYNIVCAHMYVYTDNIETYENGTCITTCEMTAVCDKACTKETYLYPNK